MRRVVPSAVGLLLCGCVIAAPSADAAISPKSLSSAILTALSAEHSVHYVTADSGPNFRTSMVSDAAQRRGIQRITVVRRGRTGHVTVLVIHSTVYFRGDGFALHAYMALTTSQAARDAGHWLTVPHSSPLYASIAADVTFASFVGHLLPRGHLSVVSTEVSGRKLVGLRGSEREHGVTLNDTVYTSRGSNKLPIEGVEVVHGLHASTGRVRLSRWNEQVRVQAPSHASRIS